MIAKHQIQADFEDAHDAVAPGPYLEEGRVQAKFGEVGTAGFQPLPDVLLFHQGDLGLRSEDLNVLLQIMAHWYVPDRMPFPRVSTIARRMQVSERTVQRSLGNLRKLGLIKKARTDGKDAYDLTPLVSKLRPYARRRLALRSAARMS